MKIGKKHLRTSILRLLIFMGLVGLASACKKSNVRVYPESGSSDVPVNSAIMLIYDGHDYIDEKFIKKENYKLTDCTHTASPSENSQSSKNEDSEKEGEEEKPTEQQDSSEEIVEFEILPVIHGQAFDRTLDGDQKEKIRPTAVILVPKVDETKTTPLEIETRYCVAYDTIETKDETFRGKKISFTTEEETDFEFSTTATPVWGHYRELEHEGENSRLSSEDAIVLKFDRPIFPGDLEDQTLACKKPLETPQAETGCGEYGMISASHSLIQFENFEINQERKFPLMTYDTYGVIGSPSWDSGDGETVGPEHLLRIQQTGRQDLLARLNNDSSSEVSRGLFRFQTSTQNAQNSTYTVLEVLGNQGMIPFWVTQSPKTK